MDYSDLENKKFFNWLDKVKDLLPPNMSVHQCRLIYKIKVEEQRIRKEKC